MLREGVFRVGLLGLWISTVCLTAGQLAEEEEKTIVDLHNRFRGKVAPSATNMQKMRWSEALKIQAEAYAAKCVWDHNPERGDTGENLFVTTGSFGAELAVTSWYMEHEYYNYSNDSCPEDKLCGHYTQVVWATTYSVGCAYHRCETIEGLDYEKVTLLVCNYYPPGNVVGELPYEEGNWCSNCPGDLTQCKDNLCVPESPEPSAEPGEESTESPRAGTNGPQTPPSSFCPDTEQWTGQPDDFPSVTMGTKEEEMGEEKREEEGGAWEEVVKVRSSARGLGTTTPLFLIAFLLALVTL